jgi:hypothetical protein
MRLGMNRQTVASILVLSVVLGGCESAAPLVVESPEVPTPPTVPVTPSPTPTPPTTPPAASASWVGISPPVNVNGGSEQFGFQTIGLSPANPSVVYVGTCYFGIWKTTNQGASWSHRS